MRQMLTSKQVMELLNIKSETTLIKYERTGLVKVARRLGNQKRYSAEHIAKLTGNYRITGLFVPFLLELNYAVNYTGKRKNP
jgi:predicted site-specific integrase-resolvase